MAFELKHLLYCAGVISCIVLLFSFIPSQIIAPQYSTPSYSYLGVELGTFGETEQFKDNVTEFSTDAGAYRVRTWDLGGNSWVMFIDDRGTYVDWVMLGVRVVSFGVWLNTEWCSWYNATGHNHGTNLTESEWALDDGSASSMKYTATYETSQEKSCTVFFLADVPATYSSISSGIMRHNATVFQGIGVSNDTATVSGFQFFIQLLTFQTPDIHPMVNILIWVAVGLPTAYVVYELIRSLIPLLNN